MKLRITFKDGLELLLNWDPPTDAEGNLYVPYEFVVARPDSGKPVWVIELDHVGNRHRKLPRYHETDREVIV